VLNYFPLLLLTKDGKNLTPARLPRRERAIVAATCDRHLRFCVQAIKPRCLRLRSLRSRAGSPRRGTARPRHSGSLLTSPQPSEPSDQPSLGRARRGGTLRRSGRLAELVRQDKQHRL